MSCATRRAFSTGGLVGISFVAACCTTTLALPTAGEAVEPRLPSTIDARRISRSQRNSREWTARDIVEIRRITGLALSQDAHHVAFIVKQPFVDADDVRYGLYVLERGTSPAAVAHKLAESAYIADLSPHPGTSLWTVRGDFGSGVQLYDVDAEGKTHVLVENSELSSVGGNLGVIRSPIEGSHPTGVLAYKWAPNGASFWYTRVRRRTAQQLEQMYDDGTVYDSDSTFSFSIGRPSNPMLGTELRWVNLKLPQDRLLTFAPLNEIAEQMAFYPDETNWTADGKHLRYQLVDTGSGGEIKYSRWTMDIATGKSTLLPQGSASSSEMIGGVPLPDSDGYLAVKATEDARHLAEFAQNGSMAHDYGAVEFVGLVHGAGPWWAVHGPGHNGYINVRYRDHDGLAVFPPSKTDPLQKVTDHLTDCELAADLAVAVCVRENLTLAPEIVEVTLPAGRITTISRPGSHYESIQSLKSEYHEWKNRFGSTAVGYLTYPRGYSRGQKYPAVVVTHAADAGNRFAAQEFQWDHPVQLLAAAGYAVLSLNDPDIDGRTRAANEFDLTATGRNAVEQMQFYKSINPLASLEAAVQWAIEAGIVDAEHVGIAGYSRGCEVVEFALAHSRMFKAGIDGDGGGWNAGAYWASGTSIYRSLYRGMYGGSPYDPAAIPNYQKYNPAFRAADFSGPLLQQFAVVSGIFGLELNSLLRDAKVPNELILYPDETHLFWQPRHRVAAMSTDLDWFDYWLLDRRDPAPEKQERYSRWDGLKKAWRLKLNSKSD